MFLIKFLAAMIAIYGLWFVLYPWLLSRLQEQAELTQTHSQVDDDE